MKLYFRYVAVHFQSLLEYKLSFIMNMIGQFLVSFNIIIGMFFLFQTFPTVEGFTLDEVIFCYSLFLFSYSFAEIVFRSFDQFPLLIKSGDFDRILLRPRGIILQVLGNKIEFSRIGRLLQSVLMFVYSVHGIQIHWTGNKYLGLILVLIGGTALFASLYLIFAGICFFTLEGLELMNIFTDGAREFGRYPVSIYGQKVLKIATFMIPYALVQYYPFLYLVDRSDNFLYLLAPLGVVVFTLAAYSFWRFGLKHYQSVGS